MSAKNWKNEMKTQCKVKRTKNLTKNEGSNRLAKS